MGHFATYAISGGLFWQIAPARHDAVIIFFVLSGFVIAHAVARNERNPATYFVNRAARIYSVAVPAIVLTFLLDLVALRLDPGYCAQGCSPGPAWLQLLTSLTFTNQIWNIQMFPGSDGPYWSLGFEVPYYLMFGLAIFGHGIWRIVLPLAVLAVTGPTIAILFPLWLLGVWLYRVGVPRMPEWAGWALFLGSLASWGVVQALAQTDAPWLLDFPVPLVWRERLPADYVTGLAFAANIIGFQTVSHRFSRLLTRIQKSIRWLAARTFTLYLLHFPLIRFLSAFLPWGNQAPLTRFLALTGTSLAVVAMAELFERRKQPWRRFFTACVGGIRAPA
jgi:peptidoglycan/LPS O-acetylase OafA/YrhL